MQAQLFNRDKRSGALFSECKAYRYFLWRIWDESKPVVMFIGLNPSLANETQLDPTIRRVKTFAENWGFGGFYMMNLFPFVTPYPEALIECSIEAMKINLFWITTNARECGEIVFAWGSFKAAKAEGQKMTELFPYAKCLKKTKDGSPWHPLYVKGDTQLIRFKTETEL
jgi:hypothetical protein